jgi:hypothetical protein
LGVSDSVATRGSFCRLKWAGCDADHSPLSNADVKNDSYLFAPYVSLHGLCRDSFNPLNADLNSICHLLALLGAHHIHVSRIRVNK